MIPGHLTPSKQPECGRFGRGVGPSTALSSCAVAKSTQHETLGVGPHPH